MKINRLFLLIISLSTFIFVSCNEVSDSTRVITIDINEKVVNNASEVFESIDLLPLKTDRDDPVYMINLKAKLLQRQSFLAPYQTHLWSFPLLFHLFLKMMLL